jgi:predicted transcriptional regulator
VAEHPQEQEQEEPESVAELTTDIVVAYVARNAIAPTDLGDLIGAVARALGALGREQAEPVKPEPAVPVRRSIHDDHLVCLVCGKQQKTLRRHLDVAHQLTPEAYREQFGLGADYPMAAPGYSRQRSEMAKRVGLGRRGQATSRRRRPKDRIDTGRSGQAGRVTAPGAC